ncbi:DUF1905 domain-containing protein [Hymenobacter weizhouensis]|uniref:DUF1905 domain-containing protein n=1 Tax=Hymenobacter sp. YIM 151500-1 TaxID=2987689 RepID=UPI002226A207|nr:DUF1905 domain-containing protein [Hymenobacter sp. YIM 151500-1]UYZ61794.1 DUF1905 domain-containing protein [Hymenobacter sp. YIM 151500-1]
MPTEFLNTTVTLEKFPGKGGWTYAPLTGFDRVSQTHFGMQKVSGWLDEVELPTATLMPMGQGRLFLPINAALRKQLGKQAGDAVHLRLFAADDAAAAAVSLLDFEECLADTPAALRTFRALAPAQQQSWVAWVAAAADEQQVLRVEKACVLLAQGATERPPRG